MQVQLAGIVSHLCVKMGNVSGTKPGEDCSAAHSQSLEKSLFLTNLSSSLSLPLSLSMEYCSIHCRVTEAHGSTSQTISSSELGIEVQVDVQRSCFGEGPKLG